MNRTRLARLLALTAGLLDLGTGAGLVFLPAKILTLMRVPVPADEAIVYVRFVGAFVAAVGACYLWALLLGGAARLRGLLEFTILFRLAAGAFSAIAIARGWLVLGWASVPATDFALAGIQLWLITQLPAHDAPSSH
jgi:hypothetical protein